MDDVSHVVDRKLDDSPAAEALLAAHPVLERWLGINKILKIDSYNTASCCVTNPLASTGRFNSSHAYGRLPDILSNT